MKNRKKYIRISFILFILLIVSCRTLPPPPEYDIASLLPDECNLILRIKVPGNKELLSAVMTSSGAGIEKIKPVLERTVTAAIGLELTETATSLMNLPTHLATVGVWPRGILGNLLGSEWKRVTLKSFLWEGPNGRQLQAVSNELLLMSQGRMKSMTSMNGAERIGRESRAVAWELPDGDLVIALKDMDYISRLLPPAEGRIELLTLALFRDGIGKNTSLGANNGQNSYSVVLNLTPTVQKQAKGIALGLRLTLSARFGKSSIPQERELLSRTSVDVAEGIIRMEMQGVGVDMLIDFYNRVIDTF